MNTIIIVLPILTLLMFDLGLALKPQDFALIAARPKPVLVGLVGQILLLPLIAWGVGNLFHLSPLFMIGIMLVACSPGGSSSNVFSMLAKGDVALSVTLTACSSIITLFTLPLIMTWVTLQVGETAQIQLPVGNLLVQNLVLMAVPIALGLLISVFRPTWAQTMHRGLRRIAMPALVLLVSVFFFQHRTTLMAEFGSLGLTMTVLILASTSAGALLSWITRLLRQERRTLVIEIGMQNSGLATSLAATAFSDLAMATVPGAIFSVWHNISGAILANVYRRKE